MKLPLLLASLAASPGCHSNSPVPAPPAKSGVTTAEFEEVFGPDSGPEVYACRRIIHGGCPDGGGLCVATLPCDDDPRGKTAP